MTTWDRRLASAQSRLAPATDAARTALADALAASLTDLPLDELHPDDVSVALAVARAVRERAGTQARVRIRRADGSLLGDCTIASDGDAELRATLDQARRDDVPIAPPPPLRPDDAAPRTPREALADALERARALAPDRLAGFVVVELDPPSSHGATPPPTLAEAVALTARALAHTTRASDHVQPLDDGRFAIASAGFGSVAPLAGLADRARAAVAAESERAGHRLTASVGAAAGAPGVDATALLDAAMAALRLAVQRGRDRVVVRDGTGRPDELRQRAAHAVRRGTLTEVPDVAIELEPIVELATGRTVAVEAFAISRGATTGDQTLNENELDTFRAVLGSSARQMAELDSNTELALVVAVPGRCAELPELATVVRAALDASGLDPRRLTLALPVAGATARPSSPARQALRSLGVAVALDGVVPATGVARAVAAAGVEVVRLAPSTADLLATDAGRSLTGEVLTALTSLGCHAIATGVRHTETARSLASAGCPLAQGPAVATTTTFTRLAAPASSPARGAAG